MTVGRKHWAIAQGWIPPIGDETVSLLNVSFDEAHVEITVYYSDRDPVGPYRITVPARRVKNVHFNYLTDPEPILRATDYAITIESNVPIVVQRPRLDSNQEEDALVTFASTESENRLMSHDDVRIGQHTVQQG